MKKIIMLTVLSFLNLSCGKSQLEYGVKDTKALTSDEEILENKQNIQFQAQKFIDSTKDSKSNWQAIEPYSNVVLSKCKVPLTFKWLKTKDMYFAGEPENVWYLNAHCDTSYSIQKSKWDLEVQTSRINEDYKPPKPQQTLVQQSLGNEKIEGLKYIDDKARELIELYNLKHNTDWYSLEPDARIIVYKCAVPMNAEWIKEEKVEIVNQNTVSWSVKVTCSKTVSSQNYPKGKSWEIIVPTTRSN